MKAIALISGGLDSTLATRLMQELGLELVALNTITPFCLCNRKGSSGCINSASLVAKNLGLKLISLDVSAEFLQILKNPQHGYGSQMNPCIDCRILLFKKAKEVMAQEGAFFVITGEVLGQRPMSQRRKTLGLIEKEAGLEGLVLRPLSAQLIAQTIPEERGWVKREQLLGINGRGRKEQIRLAEEFGVNDYPCPSGGCLLTDPEFSKRLKDLMKYAELNLNEIHLLKLGRHFRLSRRAKLVVGRNEKENRALELLVKENDYLFSPPQDLAGPTALGRGFFDADFLRLSAQIVLGYCDLNGQGRAEIICQKVGIVPATNGSPGRSLGEEGCPYEKLDVSPLEEKKLVALRI